MLQLQVKQATEDRDVLDGQLPRGGGPMAGRLAAAEKDLAALEELLPLETRRIAARQDAAAAGTARSQAERELSLARRRWREVLLPGRACRENSPPSGVKQLARRCDQIAQLQRQLVQRTEELADRRRELDCAHRAHRPACGRRRRSTSARAHPPSNSASLPTRSAGKRRSWPGARPIRAAVAAQSAGNAAKHEDAMSRLGRRRRELLRESGCRDEQEFRRRAVEAARADVLKRDREALDREITATIAGHCPQEADSPAIGRRGSRGIGASARGIARPRGRRRQGT